MTEGQIAILNQVLIISRQTTILDQTLIISMHIASLVKRHCYLLEVIVRKQKIWACLWQIALLIFDEICPLAIPKQILMSMHIPVASLVKIPCYLHKL